MKRVFQASQMALVVSLFLFNACNKEKLPPNKNDITMDGASFDVTMASILGVSIDGEGHAGIAFVSTDGSISKTLNIDIEYFVAKPVAGDYAFPQTGTARYLDDWLTSYSEINGTNFVSTNLASGTVSVTHNGEDNYTVIMDLTMDDGTVFKGTYTNDFVVAFNNG